MSDRLHDRRPLKPSTRGFVQNCNFHDGLVASKKQLIKSPKTKTIVRRSNRVCTKGTYRLSPVDSWASSFWAICRYKSHRRSRGIHGWSVNPGKNSLFFLRRDCTISCWLNTVNFLGQFTRALVFTETTCLITCTGQHLVALGCSSRRSYFYISLADQGPAQRDRTRPVVLPK